LAKLSKLFTSSFDGAMSRSRWLIDLSDLKRFPVMRGGYKSTWISEKQTAEARSSAGKNDVSEVEKRSYEEMKR
jgi:hypothetical protein